MPKEYTHWCAAEALIGCLPESFADPARRFRRLYLLGAMAPDVLFYYKRGPLQQLFRRTADELHGENGADTYRPIKNCARRYGRNLPGAVLAFLCGYVSHITTDCAFHPLVLFFAGTQKYDHHAIETTLDLYWSRSRKLPAGRFVGRVIRGAEIPRAGLLDLLELAYFPDAAPPRRELASSLRQYSLTQRLFWSRLGSWLIRRAAAADPLQRDAVSSYYQRCFYDHLAAFAKPIAYRHPVTGAAAAETVEEIMNRAVVAANREIGGIFRNHGCASWPAEVETLSGPNLYTGLAQGARADMIHFSASGPAGLLGAGRSFQIPRRSAERSSGMP